MVLSPKKQPKLAIDVAREYWEKYGLIVVPAKRGSKHPTIPWQDINKIETALSYWPSGKDEQLNEIGLQDKFNYACLTGPSNVTVIDYDNWPKENGLPNEYIKTLTTKTPRGLHCYYRILERDVGNSVSRENKTDIRGKAGVAILPPSIGENGGKYSILNSSPIAEITYEQFLKIVPWYQQEIKVRNGPGWFSELYGAPINNGERNDTIAKCSGYLINKGLTIDDVYSILCHWNFCQFSAPLEEEEIYTTIKSIAKKHEREKLNGSSQTDAFESRLKQAESDSSNPFN